jgi:hypothetical protein
MKEPMTDFITRVTAAGIPEAHPGTSSDEYDAEGSLADDRWWYATAEGGLVELQIVTAADEGSRPLAIADGLTADQAVNALTDANRGNYGLFRHMDLTDARPLSERRAEG